VESTQTASPQLETVYIVLKDVLMDLILLVGSVVAAYVCCSPLKIGDQTRNLDRKLSRVSSSSCHLACEHEFDVQSSIVYMGKDQGGVETTTELISYISTRNDSAQHQILCVFIQLANATAG
jgi:hypothetical protein